MEYYKKNIYIECPGRQLDELLHFSTKKNAIGPNGPEPFKPGPPTAEQVQKGIMESMRMYNAFNGRFEEDHPHLKQSVKMFTHNAVAKAVI